MLNRDYTEAGRDRAHDQLVGQSTESKPLEDISRIADRLNNTADELDAYLERFNGPRPTEIAKGDAVAASRCYRNEIERLDNLVRRIGSITDLIGRLG